MKISFHSSRRLYFDCVIWKVINCSITWCLSSWILTAKSHWPKIVAATTWPNLIATTTTTMTTIIPVPIWVELCLVSVLGFFNFLFIVHHGCLPFCFTAACSATETCQKGHVLILEKFFRCEIRRLKRMGEWAYQKLNMKDEDISHKQINLGVNYN